MSVVLSITAYLFRLTWRLVVAPPFVIKLMSSKELNFLMMIIKVSTLAPKNIRIDCRCLSVLFDYYQCQLQFALGSLCTPNQFMSSSRTFKQMYIFCALLDSWSFMCSNISIEMCRLVEYVPLGPCVSKSILGTILDLLKKIPPQVPKLFIPFLVAVSLNQHSQFFQ
jgi:hypothetical protein